MVIFLHALLISFLASFTTAFVPLRVRHLNAPATSLRMGVGGKAAFGLQKLKDPAATEQTVIGLMETKELTREQAEERYGDYLVDPDGFALNAFEEQNKVDGYANWEEATVGRSDDPEATRKRIDDFKRTSSYKAYAVVTFFCSLLLYQSYQYQHPM